MDSYLHSLLILVENYSISPIFFSDRPEEKIKYYNILTYERLKKDSNLEERATETDPVEWI